MSTEFNVKATKFTLAVAMAFGCYNFAQRPETTNAVKAFTSPVPNCQEIISPVTQFDTIVIFGADEEKGKLTPNNKDLITAGAAAFVLNYAPRILVIGDIQGYRKRAIYEQIDTDISEISGGKTDFSRDKLQFINRSYTYGQGMTDLNEYLDVHGLHQVFAISPHEDYQRLNLLGENLGIEMVIAPVGCSTDDDKVAANKLLIVESFIDPHEQLPAFFMSELEELINSTKR